MSESLPTPEQSLAACKQKLFDIIGATLQKPEIIRGAYMDATEKGTVRAFAGFSPDGERTPWEGSIVSIEEDNTTTYYLKLRKAGRGLWENKLQRTNETFAFDEENIVKIELLAQIVAGVHLSSSETARLARFLSGSTER